MLFRVKLGALAEGVCAALHQTGNSLDHLGSIEGALLSDESSSTRRAKYDHAVGLTEHRDVRIVSGYYALRAGAPAAKHVNDRLDNEGVVEVILWLI